MLPEQFRTEAIFHSRTCMWKTRYNLYGVASMIVESVDSICKDI